MSSTLGKSTLLSKEQYTKICSLWYDNGLVYKIQSNTLKIFLFFTTTKYHSETTYIIDNLASVRET